MSSKLFGNDNSIWTKIDNMDRHDVDATYVYKPGVNTSSTPGERLFKELDERSYKEKEVSNSGYGYIIGCIIIALIIVIFSLWYLVVYLS